MNAFIVTMCKRICRAALCAGILLLLAKSALADSTLYIKSRLYNLGANARTIGADCSGIHGALGYEFRIDEQALTGGFPGCCYFINRFDTAYVTNLFKGDHVYYGSFHFF